MGMASLIRWSSKAVSKHLAERASHTAKETVVATVTYFATSLSFSLRGWSACDKRHAAGEILDVTPSVSRGAKATGLELSNAG